MTATTVAFGILLIAASSFAGGACCHWYATLGRRRRADQKLAVAEHHVDTLTADRDDAHAAYQEWRDHGIGLADQLATAERRAERAEAERDRYDTLARSLADQLSAATAERADILDEDWTWEPRTPERTILSTVPVALPEFDPLSFTSEWDRAGLLCQLEAAT